MEKKTETETEINDKHVERERNRRMHMRIQGNRTDKKKMKSHYKEWKISKSDCENGTN